MRYVIVLSALLFTSNAHAEYGIDAQKRALQCTGTTIQEAFRGNFSRWVLPDWIGGKHLREGQWLDENCEVQGMPR